MVISHVKPALPDVYEQKVYRYVQILQRKFAIVRIKEEFREDAPASAFLHERLA
jgi:hypothetical protein